MSVPDDPTIVDAVILWRRIPQHWFVMDENLGVVRPSSAAFDDSPDGTSMSVVLADVARAEGRGPESILLGRGGYAVASITAGLARQAEQGVTRDPLPEEPAHALVHGPKRKSNQRKMARRAVWVVLPA